MQMSATVESVGVSEDLRESQSAVSKIEHPRPRSRSAKWGLEDNTACCGQEKKLGVNTAICLASLRLSSSHNIEASIPYER